MVESFASTKVELFVCARDLTDKDTFSKSDPFLVLFMTSPNSLSYHEIGRTEVIRDNLNPNWKTTFTIDYQFEMKQPLIIKVFDYDESKPESLGEAQSTLGELVSKGTEVLKLDKKGKVIVRVEEVKQCNDLFQFYFKGIKLDKKDWFGKSDPYLIIYRQLPGNTWTEVYRTEVVMNTLDPIWKPLSTTAQKLCNGDFKKPIKVECYDWDRVGKHDLIGINTVCLEELVKPGFTFEVFENDKKRKEHKKAGTIQVADVVHKKVLSFIDYLRAGVQVSFSIAIDFTASNGEYSNPGSLHYVNPHGQVFNQYERAILEVGSILEVYDADKLFPVFGFGGVPQGERSANHCFALNFNPQNPYVLGTGGVLETYHNALRRVSLSGPTLFHHVIDSCVSVSSQMNPTQQYNILMILTDGAIMDMPDTIASIVAASKLPMSIIIVGVGNADFSSMEALDCDEGKLRNNRGEYALRDIVQFVPFNRFAGNPVALAAEVLKEVPGQLAEFMSLIGYAPEIPRPQTFSSFPIVVTQDEGVAGGGGGGGGGLQDVSKVNEEYREHEEHREHSGHHKHQKHHGGDDVMVVGFVNPELPPLDVPSLPPGNVVVGEQNIIPEIGEYNYAPVEVAEQDYEYKPPESADVPSAPEFKEDE